MTSERVILLLATTVKHVISRKLGGLSRAFRRLEEPPQQKKKNRSRTRRTNTRTNTRRSTHALDAAPHRKQSVLSPPDTSARKQTATNAFTGFADNTVETGPCCAVLWAA